MLGTNDGIVCCKDVGKIRKVKAKPELNHRLAHFHYLSSHKCLAVYSVYSSSSVLTAAAVCMHGILLR